MNLNSIDNFYASLTEPNQSCMIALRSYISKYHQELTETWKYGMPCFCLRGKPFCYLWKDKKTEVPYVLWVDGKLLNHPLLEQGNRAKMKTLSIDPNADLPIDVLSEVLEEAIGLR